MADGKQVETFRGVAHPWLCDAMGHLSTRHYVGMFDDAAWHLVLLLGDAPHRAKENQRGWADVRHEIEYSHEVPVGALVIIRSALVRIGSKSITCKYEMRNAETEVLCATMISTSVRFDLKARASIQLEPELRKSMEAWLAA